MTTLDTPILTPPALLDHIPDGLVSRLLEIPTALHGPTSKQPLARTAQFLIALNIANSVLYTSHSRIFNTTSRSAPNPVHPFHSPTNFHAA